jgi:hypothetical protein
MESTLIVNEPLRRFCSSLSLALSRSSTVTFYAIPHIYYYSHSLAGLFFFPFDSDQINRERLTFARYIILADGRYLSLTCLFILYIFVGFFFFRGFFQTQPNDFLFSLIISAPPSVHKHTKIFILSSPETHDLFFMFFCVWERSGLLLLALLVLPKKKKKHQTGAKRKKKC